MAKQNISVDFKEGARLFLDLANTYHSFTEKIPKTFIPRGAGWTRRKRIEYAEKRMEEYYEQCKLQKEICRNLSMICLRLDEVQNQIKNSIIA